VSPVLQATVAAYDERTRDGRVLLDDGRELSFPGAAVRAEVLRLRVGQRVRMSVQDGEVDALTLAGLAL